LNPLFMSRQRPPRSVPTIMADTARRMDKLSIGPQPSGSVVPRTAARGRREARAGTGAARGARNDRLASTSAPPGPMLPPDILTRCFQMLDSPQALANCALACRAFRDLINQDALWRVLYQRRWKPTDEDASVGFKARYKQRTLRLRHTKVTRLLDRWVSRGLASVRQPRMAGSAGRRARVATSHARATDGPPPSPAYALDFAPGATKFTRPPLFMH